MGDNFESNWAFLDLINILSFIIGLQNLELNQKQVTALDRHLTEQDTNQLAKIISQNKELIELDKKIIKLLEGKSNENVEKPY